MIDGIPEVSDFALTGDVVRCPKCDGPMDRGSVRLISDQLLEYEPSTRPGATTAYVRSALSCIACGYTELYADPAEVRCALAGAKPPKPQRKPGLL